MPLFPAFVDLSDKAVLIVGGGEVATRKLEKLQLFSHNITVVAPYITEQVMCHVHNHAVQWQKRAYVPDDLAGMALVIVAVDDLALQKTIATACRAQNILCNVVDFPEYCNFVFPSLVVQGDMVIGISTSGQAPSAAAFLRRYLSCIIPPQMGALIDKIKLLRKSLPKGRVREVEVKRYTEVLLSDAVLSHTLESSQHKSNVVE